MKQMNESQSDIDAIKEGLKDGTIDIIATDHAPHDLADKQADYHSACFGIVTTASSRQCMVLLIQNMLIQNLIPMMIMFQIWCNPFMENRPDQTIQKKVFILTRWSSQSMEPTIPVVQTCQMMKPTQII